MENIRNSQAEGSVDYARIDVTIPAAAGQLALLRSIASSLAVSLDFDIDTVADLRLAVDELGAGLVTLARPGAVLTCTLRTDGTTVTVTADTEVTDGGTIDKQSFGWMVLTTLADHVTNEFDDQSQRYPVLRTSMTFSSPRAAQ